MVVVVVVVVPARAQFVSEVLKYRSY